MIFLFADSGAHLVVVTAARNRKTVSKHSENIAWGTHVWVADAPDHMIHFNGGGLSDLIETGNQLAFDHVSHL